MAKTKKEDHHQQQHAAVEDNNLAPVSLLKKFDQLRERNIAQHVALPQIVVVGDQSSGKSSVLESLTKIPFPRDVELCTRYATQITSRRDSEEYVEISIIPGPAASDTHKAHLSEYNLRLKDSDNFGIAFPQVLNEVNQRMGIRMDASATGGSMFSDDVLRIEICGPDKDYLTVIDVPGIFRNVTEGATTKEDMELVKSMVTKYIENPRTIILAILPSNVDIATQEILSLAQEYDKQGERTIGVLTKPDTVTEESLQTAICNHVCGKKRPLALGYFLVKNRGPDDNGAIDHEKLDAFFNRRPWRDLPKDKVGIRALKKTLGILLASITKKEFPGFRADINTELNKCRAELASLGAARQTEKQQLLFLGGIAEKFQELVRAALSSHYADSLFTQKKEAKLLTYIANISEVYADVFEKAGSLRRFMRRDEEDREQEEGDEQKQATPSYWRPSAVQQQNKLIADVDLDLFPELNGIIEHTRFEEFEKPSSDIMQWLEEHYLSSRGLELGTVSGDVMAGAFRDQSRRWVEITKAYMSHVIVVIHRFFDLAFDHACGERAVRDALWSRLSDDIIARYKTAIEKAEFLESIERRSSPFTLNAEFTRLLRSLMSGRTQKMLNSVEGRTGSDGQPLLDVESITDVFMAKTNLQHVKEQIHDTLQSYYNIARKRFVDNVYQQAVDYCLLSGPDSPLRVFTQQWVLDLGAEDLDDIAGESAFTKERRAMLEKKVQDLEEAVRILR